MSIDIYNRQRRITGFDTASLRRRSATIQHAADIMELEVCVLLVSDVRIHDLNRTWRGIDRPTDVLSFSQKEGQFAPLKSMTLGDVVISLERADAQRTERSLLDEVTHLLIHGVLHLLGHDHAESTETRRMRVEEERIWQAIRDVESD
jgi:probable rRNA maturation factor